MSQYKTLRKRVDAIVAACEVLLVEHYEFVETHNYIELLNSYLSTLRIKETKKHFTLYVLQRLKATLSMCVWKTTSPVCTLCHCNWDYGPVMNAVFPVRRIIVQIDDTLIAEN